MPPLSSQQHQSIRIFVRGVLQTSLDGSTQAHVQLAENSNDARTVSALASAVRSAVDEEIASFLEAHNKRHSNPIVRFPPELAQTCFRLLDLRGRVAVSQVSRAWRRVALADCGLWNTLEFMGTPPPENIALDMFRTLLAHAGSMPFEFAWMLPLDAIPEALLALVLENMGRIGSLYVDKYPADASALLLQLKAPWMKSLTSLDQAIAVLPADWGTHWVPRLETLRLKLFALPEGFEPLSELRSLEGCVAPASCIPVLSRVFPRLVELDLCGITQEWVRHLGAPPTSCEIVRLSAVEEESVDYSPFLRACYDRPIPFIMVAGPTSISPSFMEFSHVTRGPCRMIIYHAFGIRLVCDEDDITRDLYSGPVHELPIFDECRWTSYLGRFTELSLPLPLLPRLRQMQGPPSFDSVRSLTIKLMHWQDFAPVESLLHEHRETPPLQVPNLQNLTLDADDLDFTDSQLSDRTTSRWIADGFPGALPALLRVERAQLENLEIAVYDEGDGTRFISRLDLTALRGVARVLRIRDRESVWVQEFTGA